MFTFASDSQPQVLLSQEYVLHLLPWARSLNSGDGSGPLGRGRLATPSHHQEQLQTGSSLCLCTRGRSPSGRVAGTVSVCRSASTRLVRSERPLRPFGEHPRHVVVLRPAPLGLGWDGEQPQLSVLLFLQRKLSSFYQPKAAPSGLAWPLSLGVCIPSSLLLRAMPSSCLSFLITVL